MERNMEFFMNAQNKEDETVEIEGISKFRYPEGHEQAGEIIPWVIKPTTTERLDELTKMNTKKVSVRGKGVQKIINNERITNELIVECIEYPSFTDANWLNSQKCIDSVDLLMKVLNLPGDYARISKEILRINGLGDEEKIEELVDEAKN